MAIDVYRRGKWDVSTPLHLLAKGLYPHNTAKGGIKIKGHNPLNLSGMLKKYTPLIVCNTTLPPQTLSTWVKCICQKS